jgi:hypothetical protein
MLKDLTTNHKLKGLTYKQLVCILGNPQNNIVNDSNLIFYLIKIDFGHVSYY